jgi:hypothetical protein
MAIADQMGQLNLLVARQPALIRSPVTPNLHPQFLRQLPDQRGAALQVGRDALDGQQVDQGIEPLR